MRPSTAYLAISVLFLVLAVTLVADTSQGGLWISSYATGERPAGIDRDDVVEVARRVVSTDNEDIDGRLILDPKRRSDGTWQVLVRWTVEGVVRTGTVSIDAAGNLVEYVR